MADDMDDDMADDNTARDVVEQLRPPSSIKTFALSGYRYKGLTLPCWLGDPSFKNMVHIRLSECMRCEYLPPLGQLPKLEILSIKVMRGIKQVDLEFYGSCPTPFPALKSLYFSHMDSWEKWEHPAVDNSRAFTRLEELNIRYCKSLEYFPPLGQLPKLEILCIEGMRGIKRVDLDFYGSCPGPFPALKRLEFSYMDSWETWVHSPGDNNRAFSCLEKLSISNCKSLQGSIPPHLPSLKELRIKKCEEMSVSLPSLLSPEKFSIKGCKELSIMGEVIFGSRNMWLHSISEISGLHGGFPCLGKQLFIENCQSLVNCTLANFTQLTSLEELRVYNCQSLVNCTLANFTQPSSLKLLEFRRCKNMESLPSQLHNFSSLKELVIYGCPKIQCFPEGGLPINLTCLCIYEMKIEQPVQEWGLHLCNSLQILELRNVGSSANSVEHIPCPGFSLPSSLDKFKIQNFQNLRTISSHSTLPNLTVLSVIDCPNLESLFVDHVDLASLKNLRQLVIHVTSIEKPIKEWGLHLLTSLDLLILENVGSSSDTIECTSDLHLPSSLQWFSISSFKNLKTIHCSNLPKLSRVRIRSCPKFESFGDNGLPSQLERVEIRRCDILQQKLRSDPQGRIYFRGGRYSLC